MGSLWIIAKNKTEAKKKALQIIDNSKYTTGSIKLNRTFKNKRKEYIVYTRKRKGGGRKVIVNYRTGGFKTRVEAQRFVKKHKIKNPSYGYSKTIKHFIEYKK